MTVETQPRAGLDKERAEIVQREPFVIRAHHLRNFAWLLFSKGAIDCAQRLTENIQRDTEYAQGVLAEGKFWEGCEDFYDSEELEDYRNRWHYARRIIWYGQDVLGQKQTQQRQFQEKIEQVCQEFLDLPDDAPVEIVEGMRDNICNACIIGDHCRNYYTHDESATPSLNGDMEGLALFLYKAGLLNLAMDQETTDTVTLRGKQKPQTVRKVLTTAGIVKKVLRYDQFKKNDSVCISLSS